MSAATRYEMVIGLEVHVQLATRIEALLPAAASASATRRTHTRCPVCLALPGALPVLNGARRRARDPRRRSRTHCTVHAALGLRAQELLLSRPAEGLPDLAVRGAARDRRLARDRDRRATASRAAIGITRIHMEEDAGKSIHDARRGRDARAST